MSYILNTVLFKRFSFILIFFRSLLPDKSVLLHVVFESTFLLLFFFFIAGSCI